MIHMMKHTVLINLWNRQTANKNNNFIPTKLICQIVKLSYYTIKVIKEINRNIRSKFILQAQIINLTDFLREIVAEVRVRMLKVK